MESGGTRLSQVFKRVKGSCGVQLAAYGACVVAKEEVLDKGVCQKEFEALKACFRRVRVTK
jgi:hypothetical protein